MASKKETFKFTTDQIGSEILERFSADIYSPKAIIRELVKNAFDSYYQLEREVAERNITLKISDSEREVEVSVVGDSLVVTDKGLGIDLEGFKLLISIALTEKRDLHGATGFRGIGFWSAYTGGDTIIVQSTKLGSSRAYTLTLNTKQMRALQGPSTSIGRIMNDPDCMQLESEPADPAEHGTTVMIRSPNADGRLHDLVKDTSTLRQLLLEGCSCRIEEESKFVEEITQFYVDHGVVPAVVKFQGKEIVRAIPADVGTLTPFQLEIQIGKKRQVVAWGWYATNKENGGLKSPFAGIRLFHNGFPIGPPNPYSKRKYPDSEVELTRADLLDWHVGEIHLDHDMLRPNASGEELRDSLFLSAFREQLRLFYEQSLTVISRTKQLTESTRKEYVREINEVAALAEKASDGKLKSDDKARLVELGQKVQKDNELAQKRLPADAKSTDKAKILRVDLIKQKRASLHAALKEIQKSTGLQLTGAKDKKVKPSKAKPKKSGSGNGSNTVTVPIRQLFAIIDEIRDLVIECTTDDSTLQDALLEGINDIVEKIK